jgi:hypothetical protein
VKVAGKSCDFMSLFKFLFEILSYYENVGSVRTVFYCPSDVFTRPV